VDAAAGTFKSLHQRNDTEGLVVLRSSGWDPGGYALTTNGPPFPPPGSLNRSSPDSITTGGNAKTRGWVERGIFVEKPLGFSP